MQCDLTGVPIKTHLADVFVNREIINITKLKLLTTSWWSSILFIQLICWLIIFFIFIIFPIFWAIFELFTLPHQFLVDSQGIRKESQESQEWTRNEPGILEWWNSLNSLVSFLVHSQFIPNIPSSTRNGTGIFPRNPPGMTWFIPGHSLLLVRKANTIKGNWTWSLTEVYLS